MLFSLHTSATDIKKNRELFVLSRGSGIPITTNKKAHGNFRERLSFLAW